jgi:hypothetical protein
MPADGCALPAAMSGEFGTSPREKGSVARTLPHFRCRGKGRNTCYGVVVVAVDCASVDAAGGRVSDAGASMRTVRVEVAVFAGLVGGDIVDGVSCACARVEDRCRRRVCR